MAFKRRDFFRQLVMAASALGGCLYLSGYGRRGQTGQTLAAGPLRPPGALPEKDFAATCIRCLRCVDVCPNRALTPISTSDPSGLGGTPTMHMRRAACMLCMSEEGDALKCTEVCPSGALQLVKKEKEDVKKKVRIGTAEVNTDLCYSYNNWSCGACIRACPLYGEAMKLGNWERPIVDASECIGCGLCERACIRYPHAIRVKKREGRG